MSLNTVITLALLLKKTATKKSFRTKKSNCPDTQSSSSCSLPSSPISNHHTTSNSNSSSDDDDDEEEEMERRLDKTSTIQPSTLKTTLEGMMSTTTIKEDSEVVVNVTDKEVSAGSATVIIRDFAYPKDSPLHFGNPLPNNQSTISLSSPDFTGRDARALFDFIPETEYEIELKAGQIIWVQYRQCPGWLIADVHDQTGLVPESYVELI
ncbi:hypothetical protein RMATCC62417_01147 [Rhizopus microsporus]|nr:hypothetical protein RMATCC62417_01147 [Rhizopus microsporus]